MLPKWTAVSLQTHPISCLFWLVMFGRRIDSVTEPDAYISSLWKSSDFIYIPWQLQLPRYFREAVKCSREPETAEHTQTSACLCVFSSFRLPAAFHSLSEITWKLQLSWYVYEIRRFSQGADVCIRLSNTVNTSAKHNKSKQTANGMCL